MKRTDENRRKVLMQFDRHELWRIAKISHACISTRFTVTSKEKIINEILGYMEDLRETKEMFDAAIFHDPPLTAAKFVNMVDPQERKRAMNE